jgi:hypothetical protein
MPTPTSTPNSPPDVHAALRVRTALARRLRRQLVARLDRRLAFALRHHRNTRGERMSFDRRPYLVDIYRDRSRERVFQKSVQCGISELLIIDAIEAADRGLAALYVMPTQAKRDTFVAHRVTRAINASPFYRGLLKQHAGQANSTAIKHLGAGVLCFVGSNAESEFIEFPADLLIVDEVDRCSPENLPLARDRLAASPHKLSVYASTPTVHDFGIAALYDASDAREWFVRCDACGEWQPLDFFANVVRQEDDGTFVVRDPEWDGPRTHEGGEGERDEGRSPRMDPHGGDSLAVNTHAAPRRERPTVHRPRPTAPSRLRAVCTRCGRPVDRLGPGEWVARHPDRDVAGYHISQLFVPTIGLATLWRDFRRALRNDFERQRFYNSLLGLPYVAPNAGLTRAELLACCADYDLPTRATGCTMGVDVGEWMHVRISAHPGRGVRRAVFIGRVRDFAELDRLLERYDVRCCVVDAQPEQLLVRQWQQRHRAGRIWRCHYDEADLPEPRRARDGVVKVARTASLDAATQDVRMGRNVVPRNAATLDGGEYVAQMLAPVRQLVEDRQGTPRYVWTKPPADHHRHADNYDKIASQLAKTQPTGARPVTLGEPRRFAPVGGRIFRAA